MDRQTQRLSDGEKWTRLKGKIIEDERNARRGGDKKKKSWHLRLRGPTGLAETQRSAADGGHRSRLQIYVRRVRADEH